MIEKDKPLWYPTGKEQKEGMPLDQLTLLIADGTESFRLSLAAQLQDNYKIYICKNGKEASELIQQFRPDVIVLDLMLSELDGISLLHIMASAGLEPMVMATTRLLTDYVVETAQQMGVEYLMVKPCDPQAAADRVRDLSRKLKHKQSPVTDPVQLAKDLLISLSISAHLRGFEYLIDAVITAIMCPGISITKVLYPQIAAHYEVSCFQVERSIRTAIESAWEKRNHEVWSRFFPHNYEGAEIRPSNGVFIVRLAQELSRKTD